MQGDSFIQRNEREYFRDREYIEHHCVLTFTLSNLVSLDESYVKNPLQYKESLSKSDREKLKSFLESVESAKAIIESSPNSSLIQLDENEIKHYIFQSVSGYYNDNGIRDIHCKEYFQIGDKKGAYFGLCDIDYLPDNLTTSAPDESLEESNTILYASLLESLGVHLHCTHVINQMWSFYERDYTKEELHHKIKLFKSHGSYDSDNVVHYQELEGMQAEMRDENNVLCRTHYNIMILEDEKHFNRNFEKVKGILDSKDFKYYIPTHEGLCEIYLGSVIGRCNKLNSNYYFLCDLHSSLCLNINYSTFRDDEEGILFNERLYNIPYKLDLWDANKKRVLARNMIIVSSPGGGKSVVCNNIVQQRIEQNYKQIVVEFGKSFYQLAQLYPDRSFHIDYDGKAPLGINPFIIEGELDNEKSTTLTNIVLRFWRRPDADENIEQKVSVSKLLNCYYKEITRGHSFISFYNFLLENMDELYKRLNIKREFFNSESFFHVCSQFLEGGLYENVCKESEISNQIKNKDFVVFELTKIKKDPFLISVIMIILADTIEQKLLDRSSRGYLFFDEYAESQHIQDSANDIHATVSFAFQKLRKENSGVGLVLQSINQLKAGSLSEGIIDTTQILCVLPTNETVYDGVIKKFGIKHESQINLMKSIKNKFTGEKKYSEVFFLFRDLVATVVRLELSPQKFFAYQTEGHIWDKMQKEYKINPNIETIIESLTNTQKDENKTTNILL